MTSTALEFTASPAPGMRVSRCHKCDQAYTWKGAARPACPVCGSSMGTTTRRLRAGFLILEGEELARAERLPGGVAHEVAWIVDGELARLRRALAEAEAGLADGTMVEDGLWLRQADPNAPRASRYLLSTPARYREAITKLEAKVAKLERRLAKLGGPLEVGARRVITTPAEVIPTEEELQAAAPALEEAAQAMAAERTARQLEAAQAEDRAAAATSRDLADFTAEPVRVREGRHYLAQLEGVEPRSAAMFAAVTSYRAIPVSLGAAGVVRLTWPAKATKLSNEEVAGLLMEVCNVYPMAKMTMFRTGGAWALLDVAALEAAAPAVREARKAAQLEATAERLSAEREAAGEHPSAATARRLRAEQDKADEDDATGPCPVCADAGVVVTTEPMGDGPTSSVDVCDGEGCEAAQHYLERRELQTMDRALRLYRPDPTDGEEHVYRDRAIARVTARLRELATT